MDTFATTTGNEVRMSTSLTKTVRFTFGTINNSVVDIAATVLCVLDENGIWTITGNGYTFTSAEDDTLHKAILGWLAKILGE
jgi:hypothetical protein